MTSYANLDLPVKWKDGEVAAWATKKGIVTRRQVMAYTDKYNMSFEGNTELRAFPEFKWFAGFKGSLAANVFSGCTGLTEVSLPSDTWTLPWRFFYNCKITDISLPDALSSIQGYVFAGCSALALSSLPTGLTSLGAYAFQGCTALALSSLPEGLTSIGEACFKDCANITLSSLPEGLASIARYAFQGCSKITVKSLPEGLTTVTAKTFEDCVSITEMTLPSSVATIRENVFNGCTRLAKVSLPEGLTDVGSYAFQDCTKLTEVTLPSSVTTIGTGAFWGCTGLTEMTFPASVTSIAGTVLYQASNVVRLRFLGTTPPTFDENVWAMPSVPIYVPDDAIDTYKEAWKDNKLAALLKPLSEWVGE